MEDILKDIQDARRESQEKYGTFLEMAERDEKVALGDQWEEVDKTKLIKEKRPILNLNLVGKGCRMVSAQQRQNPMDIVYYPVEGSDQEHADVYTQVGKWLFINGQYSMHRNLAFDNTVRTGIGWLAPEMNYDYDPINGDIALNHESIYSILPDPYFTKMTLEDCDWILRHKYLSKRKAKNLYPDYKKDIEDLSPKTETTIKPMITSEDKVYVTEKWYRDYKDVIILIDPATGKSFLWDKPRDELEFFKMKIPEISFEEVKRQIAMIKLQVSINDILLVYDDDVPVGMSKTKYPFIPLFGFFTPHFNEENWSLKLSGYARALIDSQREKNKTRSILMDGMMRSLRNRIFMEEGVFKNPDDLTSNNDKPIIVIPGQWEKWKEATPPVIDAAMVQLEQMHTNDMIEMGINPDLLQIEGGSAASAPTSSLQLRREQGLMSVQELFDNLGMANRMLGLYNIDLINIWPREKIEKILGKDLPSDWDSVKENARYDCIADEKSSSPTYRQSIEMQLRGWVQHGVQVPPQILREVADLPANVKKMWMQIDQEAMQKQTQMQQMQQQIQKQALTIELQKEQLRQQGEMLRLKIEEKGKDKRLEQELISDLAIAKIKQ